MDITDDLGGFLDVFDVAEAYLKAGDEAMVRFPAGRNIYPMVVPTEDGGNGGNIILRLIWA